MTIESTVNDVFRFIQLRPALEPDDVEPIPLLADTAFAKKAVSATRPPQRTALANAALADRAATVHQADDVPLGLAIVDAIFHLESSEGSTTEDLIDRLPNPDDTAHSDAFEAGRRMLSDTLLATLFATQSFPKALRELENVFRVYHLLARRRDGGAGESIPLAKLLGRRLLSPSVPRGEAREPAVGASVPTSSAPSPATAGLALAISELARLDRPEYLIQPDEFGVARRDAQPFALTPAALKGLSSQTASLLKGLNIDPAGMPIDVVMQELHSLRLKHGASRLVWPKPVVTTQPGQSLPPAPAHALARPAGVADLLVVKQQIKRYEAGEIAHVENVLAGEKKSRAHRQLDRSEETFLTETEVTREQQTELETADRFELNRETSRTIKEDQQIGFGLSLSGKYGPSIEFSSEFQMDQATSEEETAKNSSRYARDVVSRSLERVTERVRELRSRTLIRETEETNLHVLENAGSEHIVGVYQFVDKVYEAQVFNYGLREMFDFMIPEPASFLWYVEQNPNLELELPPSPPALDLVAPDSTYITEDNAPGLAATYGASSVEAAPSLYKVIMTGAKHGEDNASESGQPHSTQRVEVQIPAGYRPLRAWIRGLAFTDEDPVIGVSIGSRRAVWRPGAGDRVGLSDGKELAHQPELFLYLASEPYEMTAESKLGVSLLAWETNSYSIDVVVVARRSDEELVRWQIATFDKIRAAYEERLTQYNQKVAELRAEAEARAERESRRPFGAPPAENKRTINAELKKHCISILTQQRYDAFDATKDGTPPFFEFVEAAEEGTYIRFFEQAFEWDQMQFVFYPYFWGRKATWIDRFTKQDVDPQFLEFLKAGAARVVVPVRPGFEIAVTHFIESGQIWGGEGEPPQINSPLYVSIVSEIRERTGAPQGETAVGEPWDARVPTALVILRKADGLPEWERTAPDAWTWQPVEEA